MDLTMIIHWCPLTWTLHFPPTAWRQPNATGNSGTIFSRGTRGLTNELQAETERTHQQFLKFFALNLTRKRFLAMNVRNLTREVCSPHSESGVLWHTHTHWRGHGVEECQGPRLRSTYLFASEGQSFEEVIDADAAIQGPHWAALALWRQTGLDAGSQN